MQGRKKEPRLWTTQEVIAIFAGIPVMGLFLAGLAVLNGLVLMVIWGWLIVPTFKAPGLTLAEAIGIALVAAYLTGSGYQEDNRTTAEKWIGFFRSLTIKYSVVLIMGFIVHFFV